MTKILVIGNEPEPDPLRRDLLDAGYEVDLAADSKEVLATIWLSAPDLILLDGAASEIDGFEVCRAVRKESSVPILMLSASSEEVDRVLSLELGADDCMAKPFGVRELMARVKALLRRAKVAGREWDGGELGEDDLIVDHVSLHRLRREVTCNGTPVHLKPKEFELLAYLMRHRGRAFSRPQLLDRVWGLNYQGGTRTVDVHVRWLRQKIELDPFDPKLIETVRGMGYRFKG